MALEAETVCPRQPLPAGYEVVSFTDEEQWQQFADLPSAGGKDYQRMWTTRKRQRQEKGQATFFAGLHEGQVVATGGVVLCELGERRVGRFEDIQTLPEHRQRGLASHVIAAAHTWAARQGALTSVLVADAGGEAIGLYHRIGFTNSDQAWMVLPRLAD